MIFPRSSQPLDSTLGARFSDREEQLTYVRHAVQRGRDAMPGWLVQLPTAAVIVEPYPPFLEQGSFDRDDVASEDGSRPATYHIDLRGPDPGDESSWPSGAHRIDDHRLHPLVAADHERTVA
jgi:uncharacterized protein (DUF885 family)